MLGEVVSSALVEGTAIVGRAGSRTWRLTFTRCRSPADGSAAVGYTIAMVDGGCAMRKSPQAGEETLWRQAGAAANRQTALSPRSTRQIRPAGRLGDATAMTSSPGVVEADDSRAGSPPPGPATSGIALSGCGQWRGSRWPPSCSDRRRTDGDCLIDYQTHGAGSFPDKPVRQPAAPN